MDLKIQIATRQNEITSLLESQEKSKLQYATLAKESEEKIRKLKGLLAQASKSLQDSKKAVNEKDAEVERLNSQVEQLQNECVNLAAKNSEQNSVINRLQIEIQDDRDIAAIKANEYVDFQSYKIKAHTALQQSSVIAFEAKVLELEEQNSKLEREKSEIMQETVSLNERVETMSAELNSALDQLVTFETQMKKYEGLSRELTVLRHEVEVCNRRMEAEHQLHAEALQARDNHHKTQLEHLRQDAQRDAAALQEVVAERVAELRAAQAQIDALTSSVAAAQAEAAKAAGEADRARAIAAQASAAAASGNFAAVLAAAGGAPNTSSAAGAGFPPSLQSVGGGFFGGVQPSPILSGSIAISPSASRRQSISAHNSVRESFADLLSKGMLGGEGSVRTTSIGDFGQRDREELIRNSQKISEMLADAEEQILKLREQEQILKEEIRKKERAERREELLVKRQNVEYLKNIVLSFLETDAKEQLIPVITKVLELSPDEVKRVRASMMGMEDEKVRANLPNFGFF
ncbi:hypothetical protein HDU84_006315 [Entophlyctis sp. JEL0112]|nr:hypothetical protein HDU84_006315 [Entophlyctis sp. JEL0112]